MSCKKGGFVSIKHSNLIDLTAKMLSEICNDIKTEPKLTTLTGKELHSRTADTINDAKLDCRARGICEKEHFQI